MRFAFHVIIILAILWKYALGPVSKKLNERTEKIDKALKDAEDIEREKTDFGKWREEEVAKVRTEAAAIIAQAQKEAEGLKQETLEKTRAEQSKLVEGAKKQILSDQEKSISEIKSEVADLVTQAAEKILKQKLDDKHDKELIKKTVAELTAKK